MSGTGRGGQPSKIVPRTQGGWSGEHMTKERKINDQIADQVDVAIKKALPKLSAAAHRIMREHHRAMEIFDNPLATKDKNRPGVGRYKLDLHRRAVKMADQLEAALQDEASHDLNGLIPDGDLRSHMQHAHDSLTAIVDLIDRAEDGEKPMQSMAEIRNMTGSKLKALAKEHGVPAMNFVRAFGLHNEHSDEAFNQWYKRLTD